MPRWWTCSAALCGIRAVGFGAVDEADVVQRDLPGFGFDVRAVPASKSSCLDIVEGLVAKSIIGNDVPLGVLFFSISNGVSMALGHHFMGDVYRALPAS